MKSFKIISVVALLLSTVLIGAIGCSMRQQTGALRSQTETLARPTAAAPSGDVSDFPDTQEFSWKGRDPQSGDGRPVEENRALFDPAAFTSKQAEMR